MESIPKGVSTMKVPYSCANGSSPPALVDAFPNAVFFADSEYAYGLTLAYWSSSPAEFGIEDSDYGSAWLLFFYQGTITNKPIENRYYVRLVRSGR